MRHLFIELFHLFNLLQILNDHRMVNTEFLAASYVVLRGSALMMALNQSLPLLVADHYDPLLQASCVLYKTS